MIKLAERWKEKGKLMEMLYGAGSGSGTGGRVGVTGGAAESGSARLIDAERGGSSSWIL